LKPAWANSLRDPVSKKGVTKNWADGVTQDEGREFKPQYHKKKEIMLKQFFIHFVEFFSFFWDFISVDS
jgi:hypothetical protein